ncbi:MAG: phage tail tip lysozyme [Candidatus Saccharimonadales bacterium]
MFHKRLLSTHRIGLCRKIWNYFMGKGLSAVQAAGIMGNLQQESGLDPEKLQGGKRSQNPADAGSGGFGLMQWTPGSKITGLLSQAGIASPVYELGTQLDLIWWHMNNTSPTGVKNFIVGFLQKTTIEEATSDFEERMEGAGKPMMERRIQYAKDFYALYAQSSTSSSSPVSVSSGDCSDITGDGQDTKYTSDGFIIYSQTDPAWKDKPYGSSTIGISGCGPSAMAMIITALIGEKVTPVETAAYAAQKDLYVAGEGSSWNIGPVLAEHWGLKAVNIGVDPAKIEATLKAGGLVITAGQGAKPFTSGGHFLVIRGITADGKYKVGDSGHADTSDRDWDADQILESMKGRGGSVYAITK